MSDQETSRSEVQVIRVEDIDDELLDAIMNAKYGGVTDDDSDVVLKDDKDERIERLEELLHDIALMADNHKASTLYVEGENVALVNIRNMAAFSIGLADVLSERGTLLAPLVVANHHSSTSDNPTRLVEMAAVVGEFDPLALVKLATGRTDVSGDTLDSLLNELARLSDEVPREGGYNWKLKPDPRRKTIATLGHKGRLLAIVAATPPSDFDRFGRHLQAVLRQDRNDTLADLPINDLCDISIALDFARDCLGLLWNSFLPEDPRAVLARIYQTETSR